MTEKLRVYLVDDELPALKRLTRLLEEKDRVEIVGSNINPTSALEEVTHLKPDVLFLDIQMPVLDGFELLSRLPVQPLVIFATAYDRYALKAFEVNSIDYLLKPIEPEQLDRALNKLEQFRSGSRPDWLARPDLDSVLEELSPAWASFLFGAQHRRDFLPLSDYKWVLHVTASLNLSQGLNSFLLAADLCEPTW